MPRCRNGSATLKCDSVGTATVTASTRPSTSAALVNGGAFTRPPISLARASLMSTIADQLDVGQRRENPRVMLPQRADADHSNAYAHCFPCLHRRDAKAQRMSFSKEHFFASLRLCGEVITFFSTHDRDARFVGASDQLVALEHQRLPGVDRQRRRRRRRASPGSSPVRRPARRTACPVSASRP